MPKDKKHRSVGLYQLAIWALIFVIVVLHDIGRSVYHWLHH
jgi:hypothetical protein